MSETINCVIVTPIWEQLMKKYTAGKNMSLEKSLSQHFSSILRCVDARNDYTGLVIAAVVVREIALSSSGLGVPVLCIRIHSSY